MIAVLIVSWNVRELLRACLLSLQRYPATSHEQSIIVVDNASGDGTLEMLYRDFPEVCVVANPTNRGFTGGNNDGLRKIDSILDPDFILLLNPDTEVTPGALDALLACAEAHPQAGVIGPQLRYPDGDVQSSRRRFPTFWTALFESTWLQPIAPRAVLDHYYVRDRRDDEACEVDWVVGAAMLVRREAYRQVGGLDEHNFFMYSEELDWCRRIKAAGWQVLYEPRARVVHHEGKSSAQVSAQRMIYFNTSKVRYFAKHHGRLQATALRLVLLGMFAWQWALEGAKWLAGHRRALRAERMRAYARVLRSGLR
ncbi:MAG: glycosyl transferase [Candidatus Roseilinea sp.]|nr:MAG: glycosyl transferase [Candidatus Roseilinea sp.]